MAHISFRVQGNHSGKEHAQPGGVHAGEALEGHTEYFPNIHESGFVGTCTGLVLAGLRSF